ncbi:hypothetical protein IMG5_119630 [Ichthyophthirius multifiliis]|uniref:FAD-binding FR-type domain-containing protein n=1 Tax=Ichthyophthirius multifiliis TaxID=5932 RepID=G0QUV4_ICHMU|nr:hypothetical protein IMG5_119630 [Ichthyophthirius multifiliis]EGR30995.1 hypothetical protein IMG5_119630 [Ichthyophthirius multifiliis]|eukprot:XP_004034481.1 hypothetical protein IMG5_119630 [Ichthyophthirius multifiliis]
MIEYLFTLFLFVLIAFISAFLIKPSQPKGKAIFIKINQKQINIGVLFGLKKNQKIEVNLVERQQLSHDTYNFIFLLPDPNQTLGIQIGQHYIIHHQIKGEEVTRKYTPTSVPTMKGKFEQVIKIYRPNIHPKFPEGGQLTPVLENLEVTKKLNLNISKKSIYKQLPAQIQISGPYGKLLYKGNGNFQIDRIQEGGLIEKKKFKKVCMVAGGTGITPMYQIIQEVCNNQKIILNFICYLRINQKMIYQQKIIQKNMLKLKNLNYIILQIRLLKIGLIFQVLLLLKCFLKLSLKFQMILCFALVDLCQ